MTFYHWWQYMDFLTFVVNLNIHHICGACVGFLNMSNYDDATMSFSQRQWLVRVFNVVNNIRYSNLSFLSKQWYVLQSNFRQHQTYKFEYSLATNVSFWFYLILLTKQYIFQCLLNKKNPNIAGLILHFHHHYETESCLTIRNSFYKHLTIL